MSQAASLTDPQRQLVCEIILRHADAETHKPVIFGSRADGTAKQYSDLDIGLAGERLGLSEIGAIREEFDDSSLPFVVEVVNFENLSDEVRRIAERSTIAIR